MAGGTGTDTLSFASRTTAVRVQGSGSSSSSGSVRLQSNPAQNVVASYTQITTHVGSLAANDEFVGANAVSSWTIHATGGTIGTGSFSSYEQLISGAADDTFTVLALGSVIGISGGGGWIRWCGQYRQHLDGDWLRSWNAELIGLHPDGESDWRHRR